MIENLLASLIFFVAFVAISGTIYLIRRQRLLKLFGVSKTTGLKIYLSRVNVVMGGAVGWDGCPRTFSGPTVTASEAGAASALAGIFEYLIPGFESQPGILKTLFTRDIRVEVEASPLVEEIPSGFTIVTVGSPAFNTVSTWAQDSLNPKIRFSPNNDSFLTDAGRIETDLTLGMVQILLDAKTKRRIFWVGGISEIGTRAALIYLSTRWQKLRKNVGNDLVYACFVRLQNGESRLIETIH